MFHDASLIASASGRHRCCSCSRWPPSRTSTGQRHAPFNPEPSCVSVFHAPLSGLHPRPRCLPARLSLRMATPMPLRKMPAVCVSLGATWGRCRRPTLRGRRRPSRPDGLRVFLPARPMASTARAPVYRPQPLPLAVDVGPRASAVRRRGRDLQSSKPCGSLSSHPPRAAIINACPPALHTLSSSQPLTELG